MATLHTVNNDGTQTAMKGTSGAANTMETGAEAGGRQFGSQNGSDYLAISSEYQCTAVDLAVDLTDLLLGPALCAGCYVNVTMSAHSCLILDGVVSKLTLPASLTAGTLLVWPAFICLTSLTIDPNDVATGNVSFFWRALDPIVTRTT